MEKKREISSNGGIILGVLGGALAVMESSIVLAYTNGGCGLVGLIVAILTLAGAIIAYKGPRLLGSLIMFFSTLIGQLTGGAIGLAIAAFTVPPPPPWFTLTFGVSSWTLLGLVGSIFILLSLWKSRKAKK